MWKKMVMIGLCGGCQLVNSAPPINLDGHVFEGTLKARNTWLRVGVKGRIHFQQGQFYWQALDEPRAGPSGAIQTRQVGRMMHFRATVPAAESGTDQVQWQGTFDGQQVREVTALWLRQDADFIHDLLLPEQVIFDFTPDQPSHLSPASKHPW